MSGGGSFGYSNANSRNNSEFQNGSNFSQQVNPYQQGYLNNMMSQAQSTFAKYNKGMDKNIKATNADQGAIFDMAKGGMANMLNGGAYASPQGQAIFQQIMGQYNPAGMQAAASPNYQQFGIGNGTPVGMNPFLTGGSREGQMPMTMQPPRPGIQPGVGPSFGGGGGPVAQSINGPTSAPAGYNSPMFGGGGPVPQSINGPTSAPMQPRSASFGGGGQAPMSPQDEEMLRRSMMYRPF